MNRTPAICMHGVSFAFGSEPVIEDAELCMDEGSFISIVGPNGGGKTTLLKLVLGILKPSTGSIRVFGRTPREARSMIGYVPQRPRFDPLFPISVRDVVMTGRLGTPGSSIFLGKRDQEIAGRVLEEVDLAEKRDESFSALSGGQQQRALIARALACEPRMLLLDEPTANLDRIVENRLYKLLKSLSERLTIVLVSHDLGFVSKLVDRVVCVNRHVHIHPTYELSNEIMSELYGTAVKLVRHDVNEVEVHHE